MARRDILDTCTDATLAGLGVAVLLPSRPALPVATRPDGRQLDDHRQLEERRDRQRGARHPAAPVVVVNVSVQDGKVAPKPHRVDVKLGANVRLQVTSDEDDVLHVHGYDVEEPLDAGHTTTVELVADQPGVFEVGRTSPSSSCCSSRSADRLMTGSGQVLAQGWAAARTSRSRCTTP